MKPIIMSTEDVRCIVNGVKTMKRIPISPQPEFSQIHLWNGTFVYNSTNKKWCWKQHVSPDNCDEVDCLLQFAPFKVGDILYAREAWRVGAWDDEGSICVDYKADGFARREWLKISDCDLYEELWQQSSDDAREANATIDEDGSYTWLPGQAPTRWRSPFTMPREVARMFLRVTDVRVERVQNIAEKDAESEGFRTECGPLSSCPTCNVSEFHKTWDARNAKRGYGWDTNPFCWVIEFKRVEKGVES